MRISPVRHVLCVLALLLLLLQAAPAWSASSSKAFEEAMSQGGLKKISLKVNEAFPRFAVPQQTQQAAE